MKILQSTVEKSIDVDVGRLQEEMDQSLRNIYENDLEIVRVVNSVLKCIVATSRKHLVNGKLKNYITKLNGEAASFLFPTVGFYDEDDYCIFFHRCIIDLRSISKTIHC